MYFFLIYSGNNPLGPSTPAFMPKKSTFHVKAPKKKFTFSQKASKRVHFSPQNTCKKVHFFPKTYAKRSTFSQKAPPPRPGYWPGDGCMFIKDVVLLSGIILYISTKNSMVECILC